MKYQIETRIKCIKYINIPTGKELLITRDMVAIIYNYYPGFQISLGINNKFPIIYTNLNDAKEEVFKLGFGHFITCKGAKKISKKDRFTLNSIIQEKDWNAIYHNNGIGVFWDEK